MTLDELIQEGRYTAALRAWTQGDPEPLYAYITQFGITPKQGEAVTALLRNPGKKPRISSEVRYSVIATVTLSKACNLSLAQAAELICAETGIDAETILRNVQRYQKRIR